MRVMRRVAVILTGVLLLPVAGCGSDPVKDYCAAVESHRTDFADMLGGSDPTTLLTHRAMLGDLADRAPDDLTDEWQVFLDAVDGLSAAIKASGAKASDFAAGKVPAGLSAADRAAVRDAATRLADQETVAAVQGIDQQARDVCKVNLGM